MQGPPPNYDATASLLPGGPGHIQGVQGGGGKGIDFLQKLIPLIQKKNIKITFKNTKTVIPKVAFASTELGPTISYSKPPGPPAPSPSQKIPLTPNPTFFANKQTGASCGRHALNNLLGNEYFVEKGKPVTDANYMTLEPPISLIELCTFLATKDTSTDSTGKRTFQCLSWENYDAPLLMYALNLVGHNVIRLEDSVLMASYSETEMDTLLGYIINTGDINDTDHIGMNHWTTLQKQADNSFLFMDSLGNTTKTKYNTLSKFLATKTSGGTRSWKTVLKVYTYTQRIDPLLEITKRVKGVITPSGSLNANNSAKLGVAKEGGTTAVNALTGIDVAVRDTLLNAVKFANTHTDIEMLIPLLDKVKGKETEIKAIPVSTASDKVIRNIIEILKTLSPADLTALNAAKERGKKAVDEQDYRYNELIATLKNIINKATDVTDINTLIPLLTNINKRGKLAKKIPSIDIKLDSIHHLTSSHLTLDDPIKVVINIIKLPDAALTLDAMPGDILLTSSSQTPPNAKLILLTNITKYSSDSKKTLDLTALTKDKSKPSIQPISINTFFDKHLATRKIRLTILTQDEYMGYSVIKGVLDADANKDKRIGDMQPLVESAVSEAYSSGMVASIGTAIGKSITAAEGSHLQPVRVITAA
jgi:hypothetical protein